MKYEMREMKMEMRDEALVYRSTIVATNFCYWIPLIAFVFTLRYGPISLYR